MSNYGVQKEPRKVAMKVLEKEKILSVSQGLPLLLTEIKAHWALEHCEGVIKLLSMHEDDQYIVLILEYQPKGSLHDI